MRGLLEEFSYSHNDKTNGLSPPIPIIGDPVNGTASLKNAINLYLRFCENIPPPFQILEGNPRETVQYAETVPAESELQEQHFIISEGETGHTYESIVGPYLNKAITITVQEPYVREYYQIQNFVRFCEAVVRLSSIRKISLVTKFDDNTQQQDVLNKLSGLQQSLRDKNVALNIQIKPSVHDREIRIDTQDGDRCSGWVIIIGRGLDFYQRPDDRFGIGVNDFSLRPCRETSVVILHA
jgi:ATP-dependent Lon protease